MTSLSGKRLGLGILLVVLIGSLLVLPIASWVEELVSWGRQHAVAGPVAYVVFVIIATVLFLPGSVAMMIGGFLFGFLPGLSLAIIAIPVGAQCAFETGRWLVRPWVARRVEHMPRMRSIELALREEAFLIVVLTRLSLIIPFNLLNYAYGATSVNARTHFGATTIGMLPAIALFVYLGTLAHDLGQILAGNAAPPELGYWLL
ncbi:MAG TPA: TVP38/TMEM64 family protein, partial [Woeseiaceae bacterium]|nr:TVP38/TMEM64 family protein [Woeseiaceae bacterium]